LAGRGSSLRRRTARSSTRRPSPLRLCHFLEGLGDLVRPVLVQFLVLLVRANGKLLKGPGVGETLHEDLVGDVVYDSGNELLAHGV